jgi:hypothetical protein
LFLRSRRPASCHSLPSSLPPLHSTKVSETIGGAASEYVPQFPVNKSSRALQFQKKNWGGRHTEHEKAQSPSLA